MPKKKFNQKQITLTNEGGEKMAKDGNICTHCGAETLDNKEKCVHCGQARNKTKEFLMAVDRVWQTKIEELKNLTITVKIKERFFIFF